MDYGRKELTINKAVLEDVSLIISIKTKAYRDEKERFKPNEDEIPKWFYNEWYTDNKETSRLIEKYYYYKIKKGNDVIGCFWLHDVDENTIELEDFCILPTFQGNGYGYEVLSMMENLFPKKKKWKLGTPFYSVRNQHLYEKVGYCKVGTAAEDTVFLYEKNIVVQ